MKKLVALVGACIGVASVQASVWTIHPTSHRPVKDGNEVGEVEMTGPQQLTNAFTQLTSGDTVLVKPGTYDLAGKDRLRDGKLDLGCYQCWLDPIGMCLFFR